MNQSKKITEGALLTAIFIVLLFLVLFVPIIGTIGLFALPIPFIIYASKHGFTPALFMLTVAIAISFMIATAASLPFTIFAGIGGIFIGVAIHRNLSPYETLARGSLGFIVGFLLIILALQFLLNINIYYEIDKLITESMNMIRTFIEQTGVGTSEEQIKLFEDQMNLYKDLLPSSIAIVSLFFAFISQWLSYKILNRMGNVKRAFPPFKNLNFPVAIIWFYFFALILSLVELDPSSGLYLVVQNTLALLTVFVAIQGFSFIFFYADHKKAHKAVPITILIVTLIIPFLFMFIVRIIGIIDLGFSLKERIANSENK